MQALARRTVITAISAVLLTAASTTVAGAGEQPDIPCTPLHVVGVQGTGQSAPDAPATVDSGFLGQAVMVPLLQAAPGAVSRQLVPYAADFGWAGATYEESITGGVARTQDVVADYADRCPTSMIAITGYSQGAQIADTVLRSIGAGAGPISADRVAAGALFSSPIRPQGAAVFPGSTSSTPAAPGAVESADLGDLRVTAKPPSNGGGVAAGPGTPAKAKTQVAGSNSSGYGRLTGRVGSFCVVGDLACAVPTDSTVARTVANVSTQLHLEARDPLRTLADMTVAVGGASIRTAASVVNDDIGFSGGQFTIKANHTSLIGRLATNTDPRSANDAAAADVIRAVIKTGVMGLQAGVAVARKVLTLDTIGALATVGMADPVAALGVLAGKVGEAAITLFPPSTATSLVRYIFNDITQTVTDNKGLLSLATDLKYWDTIRNHQSYDQAPVDAQGRSAAAFTTVWFSTLAKTLAQHPYAGDSGSTNFSTRPHPTSTPPTTATTTPWSPLGSGVSQWDSWDEPSTAPTTSALR